MPTQTKTDPLGVKPGESVADHKSRVIEATRAHADAQKLAARATTNRPPEGFPAAPGTPSNIPEFMQGMGVNSPVTPPVQSAPNGNEAPKPQQQNAGNEPEWEKMAREKGWKTPEDAARSYANLEREFHSRNQRPVAPAPAPTYATPYPQAQPVYQQQPPAPIYVQQPQQQVDVVGVLARKHNIPREDAERLLPFVLEVADYRANDAVARTRAELEPQVIGLQRQVARQQEMTDIINDPAMRVPRVQFEVNKILLENPSVFNYEQQPYRWALDKALRNIAQERLGDYQNPSGALQGFPTTPPQTAGGGSRVDVRGAGTQVPSVDNALDFYKLKTAQEKREILQQMGVAPEGI